jgi:hydroxymethylglutaryl-CoA synthase
MKYKSKVGIASYAVAIPTLAITSLQFSHQDQAPNGVIQKTVPEMDTDSATLAVSAAQEAYRDLSSYLWSKKTKVSKRNDHKEKKKKQLHQKNLESRVDDCKDQASTFDLKIQSLFIGSESHPYAVKPTGTVVASALDLTPNLATANLEFACKAGTQALQISLNYCASGMSEYSMAIGSDTAQSKPGDVLEFTAGAGAGAFIVSKGPNIIAQVLATTSFTTDTPDFWRRPQQSYPEHTGRFTGEPAYFKHVQLAAKSLMQENNLLPTDIDYCVFHSPNLAFPTKVAKALGFKSAQIEPSLAVRWVGNTYSASSLLGLSAVLDIVNPGEIILVTSYGSGAGADSFLIKATPEIVNYRKHKSFFVKDKIKLLKPVSYSQYLRFMEPHV